MDSQTLSDKKQGFYIMHLQPNTSQNMDAAILSRLIRPERDDLSVEAAQALLQIHYDHTDLDRLQELAAKNQQDALAPGEQEELESYLRVSALLDLMRAKANRTLKRHA